MARWIPVLLASFLGASLPACSLVGRSEPESAGDAKRPAEVVLVAHDSFALPPDLVATFEERTGSDLVVVKSGDAGALTNKLVLTAGEPPGDVAFGVDNTFASRALDAGVFATYDGELPEGVARYALGGSGGDRLVPVDQASVCVNVDRAWFAERELAPPRTLADLAEPAYRDQFVVPGAATSSPGMAFLLSTIAEYGEEWPAYWKKLMANGVKITAGWNDAYYVDFTQGGQDGTRPIVVSYDSSPAFTVPEGGTDSTTRALLDTCFQQVEYAGVLSGAANPDGAEQLVDFLLSPDVQAALPDSMYVFPVRAGTPLPPLWAEFAVQPTEPYAMAAAEITARRDEWLREWADITTR
ncbi:MAG: thiamine ABC transporter substrate-binding protein [Nocardioides sp.]